MPEDVSLRDHLRAILDERDTRYEQRFRAQAEAVLKAEAASEKRFESVNEFRKTLADQSANLMPRAEAFSRFDGMSEKIDGLRQRVDKAEGSGSGIDKSRVILFGSIAAVAALVGLVAYIAK